MKRFLKKTAYALFFIFLFINILCAVQAYHFTRFVKGAVRKNPQQMGILDKTSAILFGVAVPKSSITDSLHIPHTSENITTEDGIQLAAWYAVHAAKKDAKGTIIMFHGHGSSRSGLIKETEAFYILGWNTLSIDFRDHGESGGTTCSVGFNEAKDVKAAYDFAVAKGAENIILYGVSMGAATITKSLYDYPSVQPAKVILEMPFGSMHQAVQGFVRVMHFPDEPLGTLLTFWGGAELGIWAFSNEPELYVEKINCPVLLQWGKEDIRVTKKETDAIFNHLASKDKTLVIYEHAGHESLYKNEPGKWMPDITAFLNK